MTVSLPIWALHPDFVVDENGTISEGPLVLQGDRVLSCGLSPPAGATVVELPGKMVMPGVVNAHSHVVQRALRGRVEQAHPTLPDDDFWSWRTAMYQDALSFTLDDVDAVATWCYAEMLLAGYTTVGEFHYLHHQPSGEPYPDTTAISQRLIAAAERVGLRLTLLQTAYQRAGAAKPATAQQRRFIFPSVDAFIAHADRAADLGGPNCTHGTAIHSVRACSRDWIAALAKRNGPLHVHVCEQPREVAECRGEHGASPIALLDEVGALTPQTTLVHATHIDAEDIARIARSGATVCLCPSTERNLGDGLCPISDLVAAGVPLAIGSDSHARLDPADELRSLEDHERLRLMKRNVLANPGQTLAEALLPAGARGGGQSLGLSLLRADFCAIALEPVAVLDPRAALDAWLVGGSGHDVTDVWVAGDRVVTDRSLSRISLEQIRENARSVLAQR